MPSVNNPDIIFLGGLEAIGEDTTSEPMNVPIIAKEHVMHVGLGMVVGAVLGVIGTYIAVKR
ncbi:MAG: hypothetical protein A2W25_04130 [candidate division Zixibacteria bacterium RBG_16_53_22]|nr:MAG: hypothetical protein A2W25_04130 [candidate division Zixibacteria bacterium RBG_16_53_22]